MVFWHLCPMLFVAAVALAESMGVLNFLWIYPLLTKGLSFWSFLLACDIYWVRIFENTRKEGRVLLWIFFLLSFCVAAGVPGLGICTALLPLILWLLARKRPPKFLFLLFILAAIPLSHGGFLFGQLQNGKELSTPFILRIFFVFTFFRVVAWWVKNVFRNERQDLFETYTYFLHPAFWLQPFHAGYLIPDKIRSGDIRDVKFFWIISGLAFSIVFSLLLEPTASFLNSAFLNNRIEVLFLVGPIAFLFTMIEKARISYLTAGIFSMSGIKVEPDFNKPWLAKTLFDYWRRFHYWVLEWYWDVIYLPLVLITSRRFGDKWGRFIALLLTFSLGGSISHYIAYPAPLSSCLFVSALFGLVTVSHYWLEKMNPILSKVITYLSIWILYTIAYPVFGLGWGFTEMLRYVGG
ncbi:MAG: hypothetical protein M9962_15615 [Oligoflexia bacterium]|nr:hypothetical protein [Oligoflexia bacterium]